MKISIRYLAALPRSSSLSLLIILVAVTTVFPQDLSGLTRKIGVLRVKVVGLQSSKGEVRFGLYNSEKSYYKRSKAFRGTNLTIENQTCEWIVENIQYGEYAVMLYHDENGNKKLDTNILGIPEERYGFSNNARIWFGPAEWEKAKFVLNSKSKTIEIKLK